MSSEKQGLDFEAKDDFPASQKHLLGEVFANAPECDFSFTTDTHNASGINLLLGSDSGGFQDRWTVENKDALNYATGILLQDVMVGTALSLPSPVILNELPELGPIMNTQESLGISLPDSFDFNMLGQQVNFLSQEKQNEGMVPPGTTTPPNSGERVFQSENNILALGRYIKNEKNHHVEFPPETQGYAHGESEPGKLCHLSSSDNNGSQSEESQGDRLPILTNYLGKYNFRVKTASTAPNKCVFSPELNKVFCVNKEPIMFDICLDFERAPIKRLKVDAVLYFSSHTTISKPLVQCGNCRNEEAKDSKASTAYLNAGVNGHIIRCENPRAEYFKKRGLHNCSSAPLEKLQPGADKILRNYTFMCMNSCHIKQGKDNKSWTLVFYLMESGKEVGRTAFNIKICRCPKRDASNEIEVLRSSKRSQAQRRKLSVSSKEREPSAKVENREHKDLVSSPQVRMAIPRRMNDEVVMGVTRRVSAISAFSEASVAGPSGNQAEPIRPGDKRKRREGESEFSSQEDSSQMTGESTVDLVRFAYSYSNHPNPKYRKLASACRHMLSGFRQATSFLKFIVENDLRMEGVPEDQGRYPQL